MAANFNTYIDNIETDFWRDLCIGEGELRVYDKGEEFATVGSVARYIGYIRSGTLKYVAFSEDGDEHVVGFRVCRRVRCRFSVFALQTEVACVDRGVVAV